MSNKHWLASYGERIPAEINADAYRSVLEMFEQAMHRFADKPAIRCFDQTLTYSDTAGCRAISLHTCRANSVSRRVTVLPSCFPTFLLLLSPCSESFGRAPSR